MPLNYRVRQIQYVIKQVIIMLFVFPSVVDSYVSSPLIRSGTVSMNSIANLSGVQSANFSVIYTQALPSIANSIANANMLIYGFQTFKSKFSLIQPMKLSALNT